MSRRSLLRKKGKRKWRECDVTLWKHPFLLRVFLFYFVHWILFWTFLSKSLLAWNVLTWRCFAQLSTLKVHKKVTRDSLNVPGRECTRVQNVLLLCNWQLSTLQFMEFSFETSMVFSTWSHLNRWPNISSKNFMKLENWILLAKSTICFHQIACLQFVSLVLWDVPLTA